MKRHKVTVTRGSADNGERGGGSGAQAGGAGAIELYAEDGENLLRLLRNAGVEISAPCGGGSRCGKCLVRILTDLSGICPPSVAELALLAGESLRGGYRLACFLNVACDITVSLTPASAGAAKIITSGFQTRVPLDPFVRKYAVRLTARTLENQAPDAEHVAGSLTAQHPAVAAKGASPGESVKSAGMPNAGIAGGLSGSPLNFTGGMSDSSMNNTGGLPGSPANNAGGLSGSPASNTGILSGSSVTPAVYADIRTLAALPGIIGGAAPDGDGAVAVTCVCAGSRVTGVETGDTAGRCFGVAFDIGTTTLVGYLMNLTDGSQAAVASALNPQARYGADVISRINYTSSAPGGAAEMRDCVIGELNALTARLCAAAGIAPGDIYAAYIAGNTTMLHFFAGLPAARIALAPYIPVTAGVYALPYDRAGLAMSESGVAVCLPGVSAYVGADALAAALACDVDLSEKANMLIDIGTNGEILIGCRDYLYACSTAAGPAFEGANIRCGGGGVEGAVDSVQINAEGEVACTTIGGAAAIGICGSGLVDAVAQMLKYGVVDETGRLLDADEAEEAGAPAALLNRLTELSDGGRAFMLLPAGASAAPDGVYITPRDVRELQNAKAAIAAGVRTLLSAAGLGAGDVGCVYLAGGFGNYIRVQSALDIGLIMDEFDGRITPAGNAAGAGAVAALLSDGAAARMLKMSRMARYVELSSSPAFTDAYIDCMTFEK